MENIIGGIVTTILVIAVISFIYTVLVLINILFSKKQPKDTVTAITGGLGQGKSLIGVKLSVKKIKRMILLWALGYLNQEERPLLYANIPIRIRYGIFLRALVNKKKSTLLSLLIFMTFLYFALIYSFTTYEFLPGLISFFMFMVILSVIYRVVLGKLSKNSILPKEEMSKVLKYEHITFQERLNEYCVVFIDEIGHFASQWDYDNPFVMIYLNEFVRFFRHVYDGFLVYTDQSSENVAKPVRVRTNKVYNLVDFHRTLIFFYKVNVIEILIGEEIDTVFSNQAEELPYYFGHLPFKWFKFLDITRLLPWTYKKYESRVHKPLYEHVPHKDVEDWESHTLFNERKYLIEIPQNSNLKRKYKRLGYIDINTMVDFIKKQREIRNSKGTQAHSFKVDFDEISDLLKTIKSIDQQIKYIASELTLDLTEKEQEAWKMYLELLEAEKVMINEEIKLLYSKGIQEN